ncbi:LamG-like jellyroll fold domain-containing protein [Ekhidna sp.]
MNFTTLVKSISIALIFLISFSSTAQHALDLSGSGNEVNVTYDLNTGTGFTVEQWIHIPTITSLTSLVNQSNVNLPAPLDAYVDTDGSISILFGDGATESSNSTLPGVITPGNWHHVAIVYDPLASGNEGQIYIDGATAALIGVNVTSPVSNNGPVRIGRRADGTEGDDIYIDEVRIWNVARTGTQINADYDAKLVGDEAGLEVYLEFENNLADNAGGNGSQDGTVVAGSIGYIDGAPLQNNALNFDGTDDFVETTSPIGLPVGNTVRTLEAWINTSSSTDVAVAGWSSNDLVANQRFGIVVTATGEVSVVASGNDMVGTVQVNDGQWHHIAATFDGSTAFLYVDGELDVSSIRTYATVAESFTIGRRSFSVGGEFFPGQIDEVRVWNVARTQEQIISDAYTTLSVGPGLVASLDFNRGIAGSDNSSATTLQDITGNGNDGTLTGPFALIGATSNWVTSTAFDLDVFAPVMISASTSDTDQNGQIDMLSILFSEDLDGASVTDPAPEFTLGGGYTIASTALNGTNGVDLTLNESGGFDTDQIPDITLLVGTLTDLLGNSNVLSQAFTPTDNAPPVIIAASTADADNNGQIGLLMLTLSENIVDASSIFDATTVTVEAFSGSFATTGGVADDNLIEVTFTESGTPDTDVTPDITLFNARLSDGISSLVSDQSFTSTTDGSGPAVSSAVTFDTDQNGQIDAISIVFSENIDGPSVSDVPAEFTLAGGYTIASSSPTGANGVDLILNESGSPDTDQIPNINVISSTVLDLLGVVNGSQIFTPADGAGPALINSNPLDEATGVALNTNIVLEFSEPVNAGSGSFSLFDTNDGSGNEIFNLPSASITGFGTSFLTIVPSADLEELETYALQIASTAIVDPFANPYSGIIDNTTLNFVTEIDVQNALNFDGDDFIDFTRQNLSSGLTYEAWINTTSAANSSVYEGNPALTVIGDNDNAIEGAFGIHDGKVRYTHYQGTATDFDLIDGTVDVNDGEWHHVAVTHKSGDNEVRIYVDGILDVVATSTIYSTGISANRVGSSFLDGTGNDNFFTGDIDEVRIWDIALPEDEIRNFLYNDDLIGSSNSGNLVLHYNFNQGSAGGNNTGETAIFDQTISALDGGLNGFALTGATSNFVTSGNTSFTPTAPITQASNISVFNVAEFTADISWTSGEGDRTVVLMHDGLGNPFPFPADGSYGTADQYGLGSDLDNGWFVVYNGYGNNASVENLSGSTDYEIAVLSVNGPPTFDTYNTNTEVNNPISFRTSDPISNFALDFDGTDDFVQLPNIPLNPNTDNFTVELWAKADAFTGTNNLIVQEDGTGTGRAYLFFSGQNLASNQGANTTGTTTLAIDTWYHLAVTFDGSDIRTYIDGVLEVEAPRVPEGTDGAFRLGISKNGDFPLDGQIDEVRIWNFAKDDIQITSQKDERLIGDEAGLLAYYQLDNGPGSITVTDLVGGPDGSLTNMDENTDWVEGPFLNFSNPGGPDTFFEDFDEGTLPGVATTGALLLSSGTWEIVNALEAGALDAFDGAGNALRLEPLGGNYIQTPSLNEATSFNFRFKGQNTGGSYRVLASNDGGATFPHELGTINPDPTYQEFTFDLVSLFDPSLIGPIRIEHESGSNPLFIDEVSSDAVVTPVGITFDQVVVPDVNLEIGSINNLIYAFSMNPSAPVETIGFILSLDDNAPNYTVDDFAPNPVKVWINTAEENFATATEIGAFEFGNMLPDGGSVPANQVALLFSEVLSPGVPTYIYASVDIDAGATPNNSFRILAVDLEEQVGIVQETNALGSLDAGGEFTIQSGDVTAPVVTVDTYGTSITSPQLTGTVDDATATIDVEVDGASYSAVNNGDGTWTLPAGIIATLTDGTYDVIVTGTDAAGNVGTDATVDELVISQTTIAINASNITSTSFQANWSEGLDVQTYQLDVSEVADFSTFVSSYENFETTATNETLTNLDFSQEYFYRVRVVNTADEVLANSNTTSLKTIIDLPTLADSLALVQIFDAINPQGLNWETARLRDWDGIQFDAGKTRVSLVDLDGTSSVGDMPNPFTGDALTDGGLSNLIDMNLSGNEITGLIDFASTSIDLLNVSNNSLTFGDLEPLIGLGISSLDYQTQASIQFDPEIRPAYLRDDLIIVPHLENYVLNISIDGAGNTFVWYKDDVVISTTADFNVLNSVTEIVEIDFDNMGTFRAEVSSTVVPGLTINIDPQAVLATADITMRLTDFDEVLLSGETFTGALLEAIRRPAGYDTLASTNGNVSAEFIFEDVVLANYLCGIEPNNKQDLIPTYFGDVFEWDQADTIELRENATLIIKMTADPPELTADDGEGTLGVTIEEDFGDDGARTEARRRAKKRKCGLKQRRRGGRTNQDDEFVLIAYGETDDNGEFQFGFLPEGTYRFFVEYPGIPLDENSEVQFIVGEAGIGDTDFKLAAFATEDGIEVTIEEALGVILDYFKELQIYPNPSRDFLNVSYRHLKSNDVTAQLVDLSGNTKWSSDLKNGFDEQIRIDVSGFSEGVYILRFFDRESPKDNVISYRVIVRD